MTEMRKLKLSRGAPFMLAHGKVRLLRPYLVANQEALLPLILRATEGVPFLPMPQERLITGPPSSPPNPEH